jgi:hypothetical protein
MKRYIIVSKKTKKEQEVSEHEWNWLKSRKKGNDFRIIQTIEPKTLPKPDEVKPKIKKDDIS